MSNIILPELGDGIECATIACWHIKCGDRVNKDDDVVELVTDKATFNVSTETSGVVKDIFFREGQEVKIGATLAVVES